MGIDEYPINMSTEEAIVSDEGVETIDETTSNEKSEDEVDKVEIDEDSVKDDVELPQNPTPSRRGGKRRRRGGRRPAAQERPTVKTIEKETVKTDDGEIEVTQNKVHEENEDDEVKKRRG